MSERELREQLRVLQQEIAGLDASDTKKAQLSGLLDQIEAELADPDVAQPTDSLVNQVESTVSLLEAEYPTVVGVLRRVMTMLGSIGV